MLAQLRALAQRPRGVLHCAVAWSGGLDSTVLLHILRQLPRSAGIRLRAIHIDHGLQPAAPHFRRFCRRIARSWRVPLVTRRVVVPRIRGESLEEAARHARYGALRAAIRPGELLLTAQHADDQLETVLLALLRGAGPAGLAAMPATAPFGDGSLVRPLRDLPRAALEAYARQHALEWIEDPSNAESRFDRNYLRARVLPLLRDRWPAAARTADRSARHSAALVARLAQSTARDLELAADGRDLEIAVLRRWTPARRADALRAWIVRAGARAPDERQLAQIDAMMDAREDAHPQLSLPGLLLRRYEGRLVLTRRAAELPETVPGEAPREWDWRRGPLHFGDGAQLAIRADRHGDLDLARLPARLRVQRGGEGRRLRKQLQALQVPRWERDRLPLVLDTGSQRRVLAIADLWVAPALRSTGNSAFCGRLIWREAG